jgi:capsule polysaccharide export protein KpsE/RkpR
MTRKLLLEQARAVTHPACKPLVNELVAEIERLRKTIVRAKDALIDGQSTQRVHDLLVAALKPKP